LSKETVNEKLYKINSDDSFAITLEIFTKFELYNYEGEELENIVQLLKRRKELKRSVRKKYRAIDKGKADYEATIAETEELFAIFEQIVQGSLAESHRERLLRYKPDLAMDPELLEKSIVDMEFTKFLLNFTYPEYVSYDFVGKSIPEKREFINDIERLKLLRKVNDMDNFELLDDKYKAYEILKDYYGREMLLIESPEDYRKFKQFCQKKGKVVVKSFFNSLGRGIEAINVRIPWRRKAIFKNLCEKHTTFVVEELIEANEAISTLNPDSVNTIRMITYYDGNRTIIHRPFMRVGRKGSFVDNGGQGGIIISIDAETGILSTNGCDENGIVYEYHPDTNIKFKGYQIPNWDKAIALAHELAPKIPGIYYIGWDFALTKDGEWIVVEGNARTQFFGQQCTTKEGIRMELFSMFNQPFVY